MTAPSAAKLSAAVSPRASSRVRAVFDRALSAIRAGSARYAELATNHPMK